MRLHSFLITMTIFTLLLVSCGKVPLAKFEVSTATPLVGEEVTFTNNTNQKYICEWDFGDGTTSTEWSPKHTYTSAGVYTATLTAKNKKETATSSKPITITVTQSQGQIDAEASSALILQTWSLDSMNLDDNNGPTHINYLVADLWSGTNEYLWIFTTPDIANSYRDGALESSGTWQFLSGTDLLLDNLFNVTVSELTATKFVYSKPNNNDPNFTETWFFTVQ